MCPECETRKALCEQQGKQFYACSWCWAQQQGFIPEWWEKVRCIDEKHGDPTASLATGTV